MNKESVTKFIRSAKDAVAKHSPEILTGIGIAGMITGTVLAVKATPKALRLIEDAHDEKGEKLTAVETVKVAWKPYIPAVVTITTSTACLIGASSVSLRRNAALATAYNLSQTALNEYKEKVVETIGEKKEQAIKDKVAKKKVEDNPVSKREVIITEKGNTLCYDAISGRYFKSDQDIIRKAVNELNYRMTSGMEVYVSLNEFYDEIGLTQVRIGDELGWNVHTDGLIGIDFSAQLAEDGTPCIVIDYDVAPRYDFTKLM